MSVKLKKRIIDIFISHPDMFTVLIGGLMFYISAVIVRAPPLAIRGGIYGVMFGMVGGLYYNDIKKRLVDSSGSES